MSIINKKTLWVLLLACLGLSACNEMQQAKPKSAAKQVAPSYTSDAVLLTGKVQGLAERVEALDSAQTTLVLAPVQEKGRYQLTLPAHTKLPIILRADEFMSVVIDAEVTYYDINALTTNIASKAMALGGYTRQNMVLAASDSVNVPDANKTTTGFRGDPTSQYGGWH